MLIVGWVLWGLALVVGLGTLLAAEAELRVVVDLISLRMRSRDQDKLLGALRAVTRTRVRFDDLYHEDFGASPVWPSPYVPAQEGGGS